MPIFWISDLITLFWLTWNDALAASWVGSPLWRYFLARLQARNEKKYTHLEPTKNVLMFGFILLKKMEAIYYFCESTLWIFSGEIKNKKKKSLPELSLSWHQDGIIPHLWNNNNKKKYFLNCLQYFLYCWCALGIFDTSILFVSYSHLSPVIVELSQFCERLLFFSWLTYISSLKCKYLKRWF